MYLMPTHSNRFAAAIVVAMFTTVIFGSTVAHAEGGLNIAGTLNISEDVNPKDTGMRIFPGAKLVEKGADKHRDGDGANLQFSLGGFGAKLVVAKLRVDESPEKIAAFYQDDLARFGEVLDCSKPLSAEQRAEQRAERKARKENNERDSRLTCRGETAPRDGMLFRVGTNTNQRVVSIRPREGGTEFTLVHINLRLPAWMQENITVNP